jgi:hypothetical protein
MSSTKKSSKSLTSLHKNHRYDITWIYLIQVSVTLGTNINLSRPFTIGQITTEYQKHTISEIIMTLKAFQLDPIYMTVTIHFSSFASKPRSE